MKEHGLIFSAPMVRALLDGTKTQTRRIVKPRKDRDIGCELAPCEIAAEVNAGNYRNAYIAPGDRIWVKETHGYEFVDGIGERIVYRADGECDRDWLAGGRWRSPRFMPRRLSRIDIDVIAVRIERLQDISEADAIAEGITLDGGMFRNGSEIEFDSAVCAYRDLWESLHGPDSWDANPLVWVRTFERVRP